jgi:U2 small nuclear ribonucleoprotein B''
VVKAIDVSNFEAHKAQRDDHKSRSQNYLFHTDFPYLVCPEKTRYTNPLKQKFRAKRIAAESKFHFLLLSLSSDRVILVDGAAAIPVTKRPNVQMPDEYLPPNKILFLQNLPETVTKDQLMALFSPLSFNSPLFTILSKYLQLSKPLRGPSHTYKT